jgi:F-type H+-transporting ATPase subunit b
MEIDWITVVAQIVNFLILVWLLKRFLYGPVVRMMAKREERIAARLAEAENVKAEAEAQGRAYREQQAELERQRQAILSDARDEAERTQREMLRAARADADARRREWLAQVEAQQQEFLDSVRYRAGEQFVSVARQILHDMADTDLEAQMVAVFARHLGELEGEERAKLQAAVTETGVVTITSCFELGDEQRAELTKAVREELGAGVDVQYACDPQRQFGIELQAGSQTVLWSFDDYLNQMERSLNELLAKRPPNPAAEAQRMEATAR